MACYDNASFLVTPSYQELFECIHEIYVPATKFVFSVFYPNFVIGSTVVLPRNSWEFSILCQCEVD